MTKDTDPSGKDGKDAGDIAKRATTPATKGAGSEAEREHENWLNGGYSLTIKAPARKIFRRLIHPKEVSALSAPGRWEIPLQEGEYKVGSKKRFFHRTFGFTWIADKELISIELNVQLVWRTVAPVLTACEVWRLSEKAPGRTEVSLVYEPRELGRLSSCFWKRVWSGVRSRGARRLLKVLKKSFEPPGAATSQ
ncbi:MAG: hypothetical protein M1548_09155 [Actinobacteria bacterium]|nr:hypothetical protein [Actinomycetota bacterium]